MAVSVTAMILFVIVAVIGAVLLRWTRPELVVARTVAQALIIAGVVGVVFWLVPATARLF